MKRIPKPISDIDYSVIIDNCTEHMTSPRKDRLQAVKEILISQHEQYDELAEKGLLYTIKAHDSVRNIAQKEDMIAAYKQKFVPQETENRIYYDRILHLATNGKCPYCQQNLVKTLDHFLPKSKYVTYAIDPYNLVPACSDCNGDKGSDTFESYVNQPFHPYYDNFDVAIWLIARLIPNDEISFQFYANPPSTIDCDLAKRIINNFSEEKGFSLNNIYKSHAAELYSSCENRMKVLFQKGGKTLAVERLFENIEDERLNNMNSWKAAMYQAMIDSDWYWETYLPNCIPE